MSIEPEIIDEDENLPVVSSRLDELKNALQLILEDCRHEVKDGDNPVQALQKLDIQISNAVAKQGINIFQMQQVNISNISIHTLKALQIINDMEKEQSLKPVPEVSLESVIERIAQVGLTMKQFKKLMTSLYVQAVIKLSDDNKSQAARVLKIQRTYLSRILSAERDEKALIAREE